MPPPQSETPTYWAIVGVSLLLCFAFLATGSLWLTLMIMVLGLLHLARHFPAAEAIISADPILVWLRRLSPIIIVTLITAVAATRFFRL
ncbi:hypothetical protein HC891_24030 [Candidatus Gracilibacteria bacterium]|nr:hypothetical protein [Candidatus Gracilibacteria bacterium]